MATSLRSTLNQMATQFATGVINAIRAASLEDILAETGGLGRGPGRPPGSLNLDGAGRKRRKGRLGRRSANDISRVIERIVSLLASKPRGLRAEQIRDELGMEAKELPRPIAEALAAKKINKVGQKRATTYFAKGSKGGGRSAPRRPRKAKAASGRKRRKGGAGKGGAKKKVAKKVARAATAAVVNGSPSA